MSQDSSAPNAQACDRRTILTASFAGALGLAALTAAPARAQDDHQHHGDHAAAKDEHAGHAGHAAALKHQALIDSALKCVGRGEVCVEHCLTLMSTGDTSLKDCMRAVQVMMPMCSTLMRAAAYDTARLKEIAKVCLDICADCEKECKKHAEHHAVCKACMESCADCVAECKKVI
jgi:Cys-rich four helix bundle protein (predicted Tat secretion target)